VTSSGTLTLNSVAFRHLIELEQFLAWAAENQDDIAHMVAGLADVQQEYVPIFSSLLWRHLIETFPHWLLASIVMSHKSYVHLWP
jgi:hypothetical protein